MKNRSGFFGLRALICPKASMIPSLARMRLATASSWRSAANWSGIVVCSRIDLAKDVGKLFPHRFVQFGARARDHGKIGAPLERTAGIDDGARIGRACLVEHGIERAAPGTANELNIGCRIAARANRPHHV